MTITRLDEEQRARLRDCLRKEGFALSRAAFAKMVAEIEDALSDYRAAAAAQNTFRAAHDALRDLWRAAHDDDPSPALLRIGLRKLPAQAREYIGRRAALVLRRLFGEELASPEPPEAAFAALLAWAAAARAEKLVSALRVLAAEGAAPVPGRARPGGKRSRAHLEPLIAGEVRGRGTQRHPGGRPRADERQELVTRLALAWWRATGTMPPPGRGDHRGFGDLVFTVFGFTGEGAAEAAYALRAYWAEMRRRRNRPPP
jgi:hypothetical protein